MSALNLISENRCFDGAHRRYTHVSVVNNCTMTFAVFLPAKALSGEPVPVLYWLSGLTCTDENFMQKAGALRVAAELGIAIVAPDTSPRGEGVARGSADEWALGFGAGYYVNATQSPWSANYQMYDYVMQELPALVETHLPVTGRRSISGHSMGGHGALICALKNPGRFRSVSALAPICHPSKNAWASNAFTHYLGADTAAWQAWDTIHLLPHALERLPLLIDQGEADPSLAGLMPEKLRAAAYSCNHPLQLRMRAGYDHGYYFVASFIEEHLRWHASALFSKVD
jgi:S-formylglutathione hydrolase